MGLLPEIERRASVRSFANKAVTEQQIASIVEAGRLAPSAKNRQSWRFVVIQDDDVKARIREAAFGQDYVGQAPLLIALCTTNIEYKMPNGQLSYPIDLALAAGFMMLQAEHEGLGSCAVTTFKEDDVKAILTVPYKMRVVMILAIGHPSDPVPRDDRTARLPIERVMSRNHL